MQDDVISSNDPFMEPTPVQDPQSRACWVGAWSLCHTNLSRFSLRYENATFRTVVQVNLAGSAVRIRVSNRYGLHSVQVGAAAVTRGNGAGVPGDSPVPMFFDGLPWVLLSPGEERMSDPSSMNVAVGDWIIMDLHLPGKGRLQSGNLFPVTHRISEEGLFVGSVRFPVRRHFLVRGLSDRMLPVTVTTLAGLDILSSGGARAIVAFGDSITALNQWTGPLASRLLEEQTGKLSLLNQGISGNRLLFDAENSFVKGIYGPAGILRFERDVLAQSGVGAILSMIGINDLLQPGLAAPRDQEVDAQSLVDGMRGLILLAHQKGVRILGGTITPFGGHLLTHTPEREAVRQAVNGWIRQGGEFDGVIDFDAAVRDPVRPERLMEGWHVGDRLHPNAVGGKIMAGQIHTEFLAEGPVPG